jgi:hypothetical protein
MKKNIFFQIGIIMSLLIPCYESLGQVIPKFGSIQLTYPLENSVLQQDANGYASVSFAGQVLRGTYYTNTQLNNLFIKIEQYNYNTNTWYNNNSYTYNISAENCVNCSTDPNIDPKTFYLNSNTVATLNKGWYRASIGYNISYCNVPKFIPLTQWTTFGVGDVFVVAGQSNASGFTRDYDDYLMTYESQGSIKPNAPNSSTAPLISDNSIWEGSIINKIGTRNRNETEVDGNLRKAKGLPLYISNDNNLGLQKFISGKAPISLNQTNEMGIAPNGFDSWSWCRFSNEIVKEKKYPVLIFNAAKPNSSIKDWNVNTFSYANNKTLFNFYLKPTLQMYGGAFGVKAVLWQQGENETAQMLNNSYGNTDYTSELNSLITNSRNSINNTNLSWFIGKTSFLTGGNPPQPLDTRLNASSLNPAATSSATTRYMANLGNNNNLIAKQNATINNTNIFHGFNSDTFTENYRSSFQRLHFDGYEPSGGTENGLMKAGLGWFNVVKNTNTPTISAQKPNKIKVTKSGSQYTLSLFNPDNSSNITGGIFYWIKNEGGLDDPIESTSSTYPIPTGVTSPYYITCYYQVNANSPLIPSQPYYVQPACSGCRIGGSTYAISRTISIPANGGSGYSLFDNIKDGAFPKINTCLSWVDVVFDENTNTLVATASANTGSNRTGIITVIDEVTGNTIQTLNVTQTASTSSCETKLGTLTPYNSSSEWQGFGTTKINKSIDIIPFM